jgi:hypothetical protein
MVTIITTEDYSYFQREKTNIYTTAHLEYEYTVDDPEALPVLIEQFCQDGFIQAPKSLIVLKHIFNSDLTDTLKQTAQLLVRYGHEVIIYEYSISKELKEFGATIGAKLSEQKKVLEKETSINPFLFTDSFIKKDKKNAWIQLETLMHQGVEIGQISAALFWALKTLYLVKNGNKETHPEIKSFVFDKMKRSVSLWENADIGRLLESILHITAHEQFDEAAQQMKFEQMVFSL